MRKWEYQYWSDGRRADDDELNDAGEEGWELVNFVVLQDKDGYGETYKYIFKRPKVEPVSNEPVTFEKTNTPEAPGKMGFN